MIGDRFPGDSVQVGWLAQLNLLNVAQHVALNADRDLVPGQERAPRLLTKLGSGHR